MAGMKKQKMKAPKSMSKKSDKKQGKTLAPSGLAKKLDGKVL